MTGPEVWLERELAAPVDVVFRAWTTEAGLRSWWWSGWAGVDYTLDARVGGGYRILAERQGVGIRGEFSTLTPPHRLKLTWIWLERAANGTWVEGDVEQVQVELSDRSQATPATLIRLRLTGSWAEPGQSAAYEQGWNDVLGSLAALLDATATAAGNADGRIETGTQRKA